MNKNSLGRLEVCPPSNATCNTTSNATRNTSSDTPCELSSTPFYSKDEAKIVTVGHLPHVSERQKLYAITFRLHDSLPHEVVMTYTEESKRTFGDNVPSFKTKREAFLYKKMMEAIDAGYGECLLKDKTTRCIVEEALEYIDDNMAHVHAYVIMPNHVHAVLETLGETSIQQVMHSLKSYTALKINTCLQREGSVWQREYYDRIIRNEAHYTNAINYIHNNPRHCKDGEYTLKIKLEE